MASDNPFLHGNQWQDFIKKYKTNEVIFWEGDAADLFFIVLEGRVQIKRSRPNGNSLILASLGPGQFFGEMALMSNSPRTATAFAEEQTSLLGMNQKQFLDMLQDNNQFALKMIRTLCERLKVLGDQLVHV
ncbi:MAG TPA: cyclic nucleotide-binding domain-containing protein [Candidatus Ozemobacteraceae bacterium]|nr:cyclic nucleotide-binding domain-containing protein [Candidatus Ozemobacteraceae bacterium]